MEYITQNIDNIISIVVFLIFIGLLLYLKPSANNIIEKLKSFNSIRAELEDVIVDFLVGILPFFSAVAPAYFSYKHLTNGIMTPFFAFIVALVVESMAFANISQLQVFQRYNQAAGEDRGKKTYKKESLTPVYFNLALYLFVVITVNCFLAFIAKVDDTSVFMSLLFDFNISEIIIRYFSAVTDVVVIFLLSLLTIPGAITIAVRTQHRRYLEEKENEKQERKQPKQNVPEVSKLDEPKELNATAKKVLEYLKLNRGALRNKTETSNKIGVSRPTLDKYLNELVKLDIIKTNDKGYVVRIKDND